MSQNQNKIAVWKPIAYQGMEDLRLEETENKILVRSVVIGVENETAFQMNYSIVCDHGYVLQKVVVNVNKGQRVLLSSDGQGNWFKWLNKKQEPLPDLQGCIDVDISATPFTNTLPIRRVKWEVGQSEVFKMVYILVPDLKVSVMRQRYTCLAKSDQGATFRYENVDDDFKADITVDSDGLVVHYPGLFERVI